MAYTALLNQVIIHTRIQMENSLGFGLVTWPVHQLNVSVSYFIKQTIDISNRTLRSLLSVTVMVCLAISSFILLTHFFYPISSKK